MSIEYFIFRLTSNWGEYWLLFTSYLMIGIDFIEIVFECLVENVFWNNWVWLRINCANPLICDQTYDSGWPCETLQDRVLDPRIDIGKNRFSSQATNEIGEVERVHSNSSL